MVKLIYKVFEKCLFQIRRLSLRYFILLKFVQVLAYKKNFVFFIDKPAASFASKG